MLSRILTSLHARDLAFNTTHVFTDQRSSYSWDVPRALMRTGEREVWTIDRRLFFS